MGILRFDSVLVLLKIKMSAEIQSQPDGMWFNVLEHISCMCVKTQTNWRVDVIPVCLKSAPSVRGSLITSCRAADLFCVWQLHVSVWFIMVGFSLHLHELENVSVCLKNRFGLVIWGPSWRYGACHHPKWRIVRIKGGTNRGVGWRGARLSPSLVNPPPHPIIVRGFLTLW